MARGLARSRSHAQELIADGRVSTQGRQLSKAAQVIPDDLDLTVRDDGWVSRAAHKLLGAVADLDVRPAGRTLDAGASTGGFTQVLRHLGCSPVYAVDVGHGQLSVAVAADPQVRIREGLNLRDLTLADLDGEPVRFLVADVSFISLRLLVGPLAAVAAPGAAGLLLVKPQFEVGRQRLGKGGVVRDPQLRAQAVEEVAQAAQTAGWEVTGRAVSRLPGPAGNVEYFLAVRRR